MTELQKPNVSRPEKWPPDIGLLAGTALILVSQKLSIEQLQSLPQHQEIAKVFGNNWPNQFSDFLNGLALIESQYTQ